MREKILSRGTYRTVVKATFRYDIGVWANNFGISYRVHGDALGWGGPASSFQTIFVPSKPGLRDWIERHAGSPPIK